MITLPSVRNSSEWKAVRKHIASRIEDHRKSLEHQSDPVMIHRLQGRIKELRHLIDEVEPELEPAAE